MLPQIVFLSLLEDACFSLHASMKQSIVLRKQKTQVDHLQADSQQNGGQHRYRPGPQTGSRPVSLPEGLVCPTSHPPIKLQDQNISSCLLFCKNGMKTTSMAINNIPNLPCRSVHSFYVQLVNGHVGLVALTSGWLLSRHIGDFDVGRLELISGL